MNEPAEIYQIPASLSGARLDGALAELIPDYSRTRLQELIRDGSVTIDGEPARQRTRVRGGEQVRVRLPAAADPVAVPVAQPLPLEPLFEDADCLVINKAPGMAVHPGAGRPDGTLQNALLYRYPELRVLPRHGLVHRLDMDTSGCLLVARSELAHRILTEKIARHEPRREYLAVVQGNIISGGSVDRPLGRNPRDRRKVAVVSSGRSAITHYRVAARYRAHTLLRVTLETGRTHQIRVHLASIGHPLLGDPLYGGRTRVSPPPDSAARTRAVVQGFRRQALHAVRLSFHHPRSDTPLCFEAPPPLDFIELRDALASDAGE